MWSHRVKVVQLCNEALVPDWLLGTGAGGGELLTSHVPNSQCCLFLAFSPPKANLLILWLLFSCTNKH